MASETQDELMAKLRAQRAAIRAARLASGDPRVIEKQLAEDLAEAKAKARAEAEQSWRDQRERERILKLLGDAATKRKRRPLTFKRRDVERAIAGHMQAGLSVQRTEIDPSGRIAIVTGKPEPVGIVPKQTVSEWD